MYCYTFKSFILSCIFTLTKKYSWAQIIYLKPKQVGEVSKYTSSARMLLSLLNALLINNMLGRYEYSMDETVEKCLRNICREKWNKEFLWKTDLDSPTSS